MFGGNAKTHFQQVGRGNNSTGYMMSPFGDDRWDLDDNEKLRKIFKNRNFARSSGSLNADNRNVPQTNRLAQNQFCTSVKNSPPRNEAIKPPCSGHVLQLKTPQECVAKSQPTQIYQQTIVPVHYQEPTYYQNYGNYCVGQHQQKPQNLDQNLGSSIKSVAYKKRNGLNHEEEKRRSKMVCAEGNFQEHFSQSLPQISSICSQCQQSAQNSNPYLIQRQWRSSSDVPVWMAGETPYRPYGLSESTSHPQYFLKEKNEYASAL